MIKKSPYLFFLCFEIMYYKYLACQILSYDFDENPTFWTTIARHYLIKKWPSSKERVGSREDVMSSNHTMQQLDSIIFSMASVDKNTLHTRVNHICFDVLIGWRHILPRP